MSNQHEIIESLLGRIEGNFIDFKVKQYTLDTERQKSAFIKDVIAMANTPRDESAYIVLGGRGN